MSVVVSIIFILLGFAIKNGKMYYLIAGYNTMSQDEQSKYNIEGIALVFRNVLFAMAIFMLIGFLISKWLDNPKIEVYVVICSVLIGIPYLLIVSNSSKYKTKK